MVEWIKTSEKLPSFGKRVLCWVGDTNLFGRGLDDPHHTFLYERFPISPGCDLGNNTVPYAWHCENGGNEFGQKVSYWAEIEGPDAE
jgi:hypothetical protein